MGLLRLSYDVIVIGAGPAGGLSAGILAKKGYSVLIIEKRKVVGVPVQCAEAVSQKSFTENLIKPTNAWIKLKVKGSKFMVPSGDHFYVTLPGYSIDRSKFDQWLMKGAVENGAKLKINTRAFGLHKRAKNWLIKTKSNGKISTFEGKLVIAADGASSNVAIELGLIRRREFQKAVGFKFKAKDVNYPERERLSFYLGARFKGYGWVFPRGDEWNIGVGGYGNSNEILKRFLKFLKLDPTKRTVASSGIVPYRYEFETRVKDGMMVIGDAAGLANPIFEGGIHAALTSARYAAEAAINALETENINVLQEYERRILDEQNINPIMYKCSAYIRKWTDEDWNFLGWILNGKEYSDLGLARCILKTFRRPKYLLRTGELLTIRKALRLSAKYGW